MSNSKTIAATVAAVIGLGVITNSTSAHAADIPGHEKCYGVVKAGKNDCGTTNHACAEQAKTDDDPAEWILLPTGICERLTGGKTK